MPDEPYFPLETASGRYKFHVERTLIECRAILRDLAHALSSPGNEAFKARWNDDVVHFQELAARCEKLLPYLIERKAREERMPDLGRSAEDEENEDEASI